jgi:23S rRNA (guanine745-N1)-methyltransferase
MWSCPHCRLALEPDPQAGSLVCASGHRFDRAREGYVNLLPANRKRSRDPGDSQAMIEARARVHSSGVFQALAEAITEMLGALPAAHTVLDLGCGEGYYLGALGRSQPSARLHGVDISRAACRRAARAWPGADIVVASAFALPLPENSMDIVARVFAPSDDGELARVLRPTGAYLEVTPAPRHLWQLRQNLYHHPREHAPARTKIENLSLVAELDLAYELPGLAGTQLADLVAMTPFAHRGQRERRQLLLDKGLEALSMAFSLRLFRPGT